MTDLARWVDARTPPAPDDLLQRIRERTSEPGPSRGATPVTVLLEQGRRALRRARRSTGRDRTSAFELLVADALITYSCEAALQSADPESELLRLLTVAE